MTKDCLKDCNLCDIFWTTKVVSLGASPTFDTHRLRSLLEQFSVLAALSEGMWPTVFLQKIL